MKRILAASLLLIFSMSLYAEDWVIKEKNGTCRFNSEKKYFEYYSLKGRKIANIFFFDNGPDYYSEGLRRIVENGKIGFINRKNRIAVKPQFDFAFPFGGGFSVVIKDPVYEKMGEHTAVKGGKYGLVNRYGRIVVPMKYDSIADYSKESGTAVVYLDKKKIILKIR